MIAVTFALPEESKDFVAALGERKVDQSGSLPLLLGNLNSCEVVVAHTGIGPASTAHQMNQLLTRRRPQMLISSGFAGALSPALGIGDIVVAENFSAPALVDKITASGSNRIFRGALTSQPRAAETPEAKRALAKQTAAIAVDMETQTISEACSRAGIPMLSLRAVSDTAAQSLPVPFPVWFDNDKQQPRPLSLVRHLILHPSLIPDFCRFVSGLNIARRNLTAQLVTLLRDCLSVLENE